MEVKTFVVASELGRTVRDVMKCAGPQCVFEPFGREINWNDAAVYIISLFSIDSNRELAFNGANQKKGAKEAFWNIPFNGKKDGGKYQKFFIETLVNHNSKLYRKVLEGMITYYDSECADTFGKLDI